MTIEYLVPTANASTATALATNNYTLINETVAGANGSINTTIVDDWVGATAVWTALSPLSSDISSVNSATFRVRARVVVTNTPADDTATFDFRLTVGGSTYDITYSAPTDSNLGFIDRTVPVGTGFTRAQYEAATVTLLQTAYSKTKGPDNVYVDIDAFELEVNYEPGATFTEVDADAAGTSTTDFVAAAIDSGSYDVSNTSTTNIDAASIIKTEASSASTSTTLGDSAGVISSAFSVAGSSTTDIVSQYDYVTQFDIAGTSTATGLSGALDSVEFNVNGTSATNFAGENGNAAAPVEATGTSSGTSTVTGIASAIDSATFTETPNSIANFIASAIDSTIFTESGIASTSFNSGATVSSIFAISGSATVNAQGQAVTGITVNPNEFDWDNTNVVISGNNFEALQGSGTVYLSDSATLAGSLNEVEIGNAISSWSDTSIALNFTTLTQIELNNLEALGPGQRYLIVVNNSAQEQVSEVLTVHRPKAIALSDSSFIPASGADTTPQLTPPSGKTVADFGGGRIQDDENPTDPVNAGPGKYREDEWSIIGLDASVYDSTYQFRVLVNGVVVDTISVAPDLIISSGTTGATATSVGTSTSNWVTGWTHAVTFTIPSIATTDVKASYIISSEFTETSSSTTSGDTAQTNASVGSVSGSSVVQGYSEKVAGVEFNVAGTSTVFGQTSESAFTPVNANASGSSTVQGYTASIILSEFTETGQSTEDGQTASIITSAGSVSGTSTVSGYVSYIIQTVGTASGTAQVDWQVSYIDNTSFDISGIAITNFKGVIASGTYKRWNKVDTDDIASLNGIAYSSVKKINEVDP